MPIVMVVQGASRNAPEMAADVPVPVGRAPTRHAGRLSPRMPTPAMRAGETGGTGDDKNMPCPSAVARLTGRGAFGTLVSEGNEEGEGMAVSSRCEGITLGHGFGEAAEMVQSAMAGLCSWRARGLSCRMPTADVALLSMGVDPRLPLLGEEVSVRVSPTPWGGTEVAVMSWSRRPVAGIGWVANRRNVAEVLSAIRAEEARRA